ncbi:MAG: Gfo/Idh/MocA family protein [Pyrinomonadaceae bacterium]
MQLEASDTQRRMRIGVCGVGSIGSRHARLLSQRGDVDVYVADPVEQHIREAERLPNVAASSATLDELLDFELDGLVVATPDRFHVPFAETACLKGIPVLLEKPIAEDVSSGEHLKRVITQTGTKVLVGYPLRHHSGFLKAKEILDEGQIGVPVSFHIDLGAYETLVVAKNRFSPEDKNKLFIDYSHEWDYLQWFLGRVSRGIALSSLVGKGEHKQDPNVVDALVEMDSGISGTAHLDYIRSPGKRAFGIVGDEGTIALDASNRSLVVRRYADGFDQMYAIEETFDSMMSRQLSHFLDVAAGERQPDVTIDDGINALRVADALIRSARTGSWESI